MELGTIAAAVQLVDLGCRSLFGIYRFVKNLKDVPADLVAALEDLGHFSSLMADLQSALKADDARLRNLRPAQLDRVAGILGSTGKLCRQLEQSLTPCCPPTSASKTTKAWRALVSVKKEQDIIKICERLERLKHDLNRELQHCELTLLSTVKSDLGTVSADLLNATASLAVLGHRLDSVDSHLQTIHCSLKKTQDTSLLLGDPAGIAAMEPAQGVNPAVEPLPVQQNQALTANQMISELHRCLVLGQAPTAMVNSSFKNAASNEKAHILAASATQLVKYPQDLKAALGNHVGSYESVNSSWQAWTTSRRPCQCPKMGSQIKQRSVLFGPFKYFTSSRQKHLANCRLYSESGSEKSETLVFPTLPFLAGTVELYSSSYHSQRLGRFSVTYHPTVHRTTSPAFELFRVGGLARLDPVFPIMHNAGGGRLVGMPGAIKLPSFDGLHVLLQHLPAKLEELFKSGEARPHERDEFGHTLMFELLYLCQSVSGTPALSPAFLRLADDIAGCLINLGVDIDSSSARLLRFTPCTWLYKFTEETGTVADLAFSALVIQAKPGGSLSSEFSLYLRLISRLGLVLNADKLHRLSICVAERARYRSTCLDLLLSPHQPDLSTDLTPMHFAILARDYSRVQGYITHQIHSPDQHIAILTSMECALGWPEGLHLLAGAGYSPIAAFQLSVFRHDVDSVAHMLSADSPIFVNETSVPGRSDLCYEANLLGAAICSHCHSDARHLGCLPIGTRPCCAMSYGRLETNSQARHDIGSLVVAAIKDRRVRLAELAQECLPPQKLSERPVESGIPLDSNAFATYVALREYGIPVPAALYPGRRPLLFSFNPSCELGGFPLVQSLFEHGVCELNTSLDGIITPLAQLFNTHLADGRKEIMIRWFLERGASPNFSSDIMLPNFLFYLASVYDSPAIYRKHSLFPAAPCDTYGGICGGKATRSKIVKNVAAVARTRKTTSSMISLVAQFCDPVQRDSCSCACSSGGCLPLHKFKNGIELEEAGGAQNDTSAWYGTIPKRWATVSETIESWIQDCQLNENQTRQYLRDACRLEVFTRLGMAHTCCIFEPSLVAGPRLPVRQQRDPKTCRELEDEDTELREQLEAVMEAYEKALDMHPGTINDFWGWWWVTLLPLLPEIPAEQRRPTYGDKEMQVHHSLHLSWGVWSWRYLNIYDDNDEHVTEGVRFDENDEHFTERVCGFQEMDFIDEIKYYFADILSQNSFTRGETGVHQDEYVTNE